VSGLVELIMIRDAKRCGAFHVASKPWIRGGRGPRRAEGSRRGSRAPDAQRMGANGRWDRMERRGDREKGGDGSRTATADA